MPYKKLLSSALILTLAHIAVRLTGFVYRVLLSRTLGAEAVGVIELASPIFTLFATLVTSGLPIATSRLCAKAHANGNEEGAQAVLKASKRLALRIGLGLLLLYPLLPFVAGTLLGDMRTLPALCAYLPCVLILGVSASYNGYFYAQGNTLPPALSELMEQALRVGLCLFLLNALPAITIGAAGFVVAAATTIGELFGLLVIQSYFSKRRIKVVPSYPAKEIIQSAVPITLGRFSSSSLQALNAMILPKMLMLYGLSTTQALATWGRISGMTMPLLFLPMVFTSSLCTLLVPSMASAPSARKARLALSVAAGLAIPCALFLYLLAPFLSTFLYRQEAVAPLLRALCPMVPVLAINQVSGSLLHGLGREKKVFRNSLIGGVSCTALLLIACPSIGVSGFILGFCVNGLITLCLHSITLKKALKSL